jgi:hypothetical protein
MRAEAEGSQQSSEKKVALTQDAGELAIVVNHQQMPDPTESHESSAVVRAVVAIQRDDVFGHDVRNV